MAEHAIVIHFRAYNNYLTEKQYLLIDWCFNNSGQRMLACCEN